MCTRRVGRHLKALRWAREHGCPWDWSVDVNTPLRVGACPWDGATCDQPLRGGIWRCCGGRGRTAVCGTGSRSGAGTWRYCSGRGSTTARGVRKRASPLWEGHLAVLQWAREHVRLAARGPRKHEHD